MDELEQFKQTYFDECTELLTQAEEHLLALEDGSGDLEDLHAIFRCVHSIKGGAGAFGFTRLVEFTHTFETLLDDMREGRVAVGAGIMRVVLSGFDVLSDLVNTFMAGQEPEAGFGEQVKQRLEDAICTEASGTGTPQPRITANPAACATPDADETPLRRYEISFLPHKDMLARANEPLLIIRELRLLGRVTVVCDSSRLPRLNELHADECYLSWRFELETTHHRDAVEEVFEFVVDDCDLTITELGASSELYLEQDPQGAWGLYLKVDNGSDEFLDMDPQGAWGLFAPPAAPTESGDMGAEPVAAAPAPAPRPGPQPVPAPAEAKTAGVKSKPDKEAGGTQTAGSIRVELDKVDRLVNMVGELVITQAMLDEQAGSLQADQFPALLHGLELLGQHTRELQESVMAIRAQPVKSVFSRVPRMVRELSGKLDREVRLITSGENTEVDKTVIEQIGDPLTHMIRNAIDHGIETPEDREAAGKPRQGTIYLSAEHRSGRIVIEIEDDGRGINRERVLEKALEKGIIPADSGLSDEEIDNLIFAPGFSTVEVVSDVSGRGVGMDVVKRNIQALGGRVFVHSFPQEGSRFTMTLPLTLAVLDGMIIRVGAETYVLPLTNIIESLRPARADVQRLVDHGCVLQIRGEYVRLVYLHKLFGLSGAIEDPCEGIVILCETEGDGKVGLVVDELLGQQQVVIKSLEANFHLVPGVSGATILGSGRVALILDVAGLRAMADKAPPAPHSRAAE